MTRTRSPEKLDCICHNYAVQRLGAMAAAVCSPVSGVLRMLARCVATGRVVPLRLVGPAVGTSYFRRRFHVSSVSQGLKLFYL